MKKYLTIPTLMILLFAVSCRPETDHPLPEPAVAAEMKALPKNAGQEYKKVSDSTQGSAYSEPGDTGDEDDEPTKDRQQWRTVP
ncbi:MAG: hypothetical protein K0M63_09515 [Weeksellaceae bacterium]|nr:hypothetical protein [Weeksellaceae bacterium]